MKASDFRPSPDDGRSAPRVVQDDPSPVARHEDNGVVSPIDLPWRSVAEWVGKTPDSAPPVAVKLRVLARYQGRCYLTGVKIKTGDAWDIEHIKPLRSALPGEPHLNREMNLAPALRPAHREKTGPENSDGAKADRIAAKRLGLWPKSKRPLKSRNTFAKRGQPTGER